MKIYFLGIGGVSMSALAVMMKKQGHFVFGSDEVEGAGTEILKKNGIDVDFSVNEQHLMDADVIVASSAIKQDDPRMCLAKQFGKKILTRGQLLGEVANGYEKVIAVAGSHGKTTTTAMIFEVLKMAGFDPSLHLGGYRVEDGLNFVVAGKEFFVTEACEYHNNFLNLHPYISVVTNIEKEHMDFFKTFSNQLRSFETFKKQSLMLVDNFQSLQAKKVRHTKDGNLTFDLFDAGKKVMHLNLHICEDVNVQNCMYAFLVAKKLGIDNCIIKAGMENFKGVKTRFEKMKCESFPICVCDYAHHPTEISKAIETAKKVFKHKKLVTIFQPHTFSRTKSLLDEFVEVFKRLECPLFFKTYSARESPQDGLSSEQLCEIVQKSNKNAKYFDNFSDLHAFLMTLEEQDVALLFVGAGDLPSILHKNCFIE